MEHRIQIERLPLRVNNGKGNSEAKYRVTYNGTELCVARVPCCAAARKLIELGVAQRSDTLLTCRGERVDMRGGIGFYADRTVNEVRNNGTPSWAKWTPFWATSREKTGDDDEVAA
jgi:hypothetical protein